ncbi:hypothetical protein NE237_003152 [Protea cynaroides]|uniref:Uncharacterized protein n=1 Tax=Protea cynaroides TaxID=273540 RepID=A0A9Q0KG62_9MAGN|nr:hypothetical protein NE237_003152 [Protea cynaroides]
MLHRGPTGVPRDGEGGDQWGVGRGVALCRVGRCSTGVRRGCSNERRLEWAWGIQRGRKGGEPRREEGWGAGSAEWRAPVGRKRGARMGRRGVNIGRERWGYIRRWRGASGGGGSGCRGGGGRCKEGTGGRHLDGVEGPLGGGANRGHKGGARIQPMRGCLEGGRVLCKVWSGTLRERGCFVGAEG